MNCDDGNTHLVDTIEHEGDLWLVPSWLETQFPHMQKPARIIRMDRRRLQFLGHDVLGTGLAIHKLDGLVPKAVLDGASASLSGPLLDVQEAPELTIRRE